MTLVNTIGDIAALVSAGLGAVVTVGVFAAGRRAARLPEQLVAVRNLVQDEIKAVRAALEGEIAARSAEVSLVVAAQSEGTRDSVREVLDRVPAKRTPTARTKPAADAAAAAPKRAPRTKAEPAATVTELPARRAATARKTTKK